MQYFVCCVVLCLCVVFWSIVWYFVLCGNLSAVVFCLCGILCVVCVVLRLSCDVLLTADYVKG